MKKIIMSWRGETFNKIFTLFTVQCTFIPFSRFFFRLQISRNILMSLALLHFMFLIWNILVFSFAFEILKFFFLFLFKFSAYFKKKMLQKCSFLNHIPLWWFMHYFLYKYLIFQLLFIVALWKILWFCFYFKINTHFYKSN